MGDIRDNFPALVHGSYELISNNNNLTLFKRETSDETLYVALNNDDESQVVEIDGLSDDYQLNGLMHDHLVRVNDNGIFEVGLPRERSEEHTSELQSRGHLVCRLLLVKKNQ